MNPPPESSVMDGEGFYNEHSRQQREAAAAAVKMLRTAAAEIPLTAGVPLLIADYGSSEGRNSLPPLADALEEIGRRSPGRQPELSVVHTDLPGNDFSALFETIAAGPRTYARPGVFSFAVGCSFYQQLLPTESVSLGWSSTAVLWLSEVPCPLPDHLFSFTEEGERRHRWAERAAADWETFLRLRGAELRPGAQIVVTTLLAGADYLPWMETIEAGLRDALEAGAIRRAEFEAMTIPTYLREPEEFFGAIEVEGLPLALVDSAIELAADPAFDSFRQHGDPSRYSLEAVGAYRAWSEPSLLAALDPDRSPGEARESVDALYELTRARLEAEPGECAWRVGIARIQRG